VGFMIVSPPIPHTVAVPLLMCSECCILISEVATGSILTANRCEAHLDGGLQAPATNDKSVLWGFKPHTGKNPCRVRLMCANGKSPIVPEGHGTVRILADNAEGCLPIHSSLCSASSAMGALWSAMTTSRLSASR